jgi:hypothetical protein
MWLVSITLTFAAIAFVSWLLWNYRNELTQSLGVLVSGGQSILLAIGIILVEAVKASILAAIAGGIFALILFVCKAPESTIKAVAISIACLTLALLMLKVLWENFNNIRWSIRHEVRNRYRKR